MKNKNNHSKEQPAISLISLVFTYWWGPKPEYEYKNAKRFLRKLGLGVGLGVRNRIYSLYGINVITPMENTGIVKPICVCVCYLLNVKTLPPVREKHSYLEVI